MNNEDKIKLLKNIKQSIQFNVNNTVAILIGLVIGMAAIFIQVQLTFNNLVISWMSVVIYFVLLLLSGSINAALRIRKQLQTLEEIDNVIYGIITKEDAAETLIKRLYRK